VFRRVRVGVLVGVRCVVFESSMVSNTIRFQCISNPHIQCDTFHHITTQVPHITSLPPSHPAFTPVNIGVYGATSHNL